MWQKEREREIEREREWERREEKKYELYQEKWSFSSFKSQGRFTVQGSNLNKKRKKKRICKSSFKIRIEKMKKIMNERKKKRKM